MTRTHAQLLEGNLPIDGEFGITAEIPSFALLQEWQEKRVALRHGYYRMVDPPRVQALQQQLCDASECAHALCYPSQEVALHEWLQGTFTLPPHHPVLVLAQAEHPDLSRMTAVLDHQQLPWKRLPPEVPAQLPLCSLVVVLRDTPNVDRMMMILWHSLPGRLPLLVWSPEPPKAVPRKLRKAPWVCGLEAGSGGALLLDEAEAFDEFLERRKRRGPILSPRAIGDQEDSEVRSRLLDWFMVQEAAAQVQLYPSGMNACAVLFDELLRRRPQHVVVVGGMYTDTYTLLTHPRFRPEGTRVDFLDVSEQDRLVEVLTEETAFVFTESITNPLGEVPDLPLIAANAHLRGVPLVVDNTLATPYNLNPLVVGATAVVHSTAKYLNGGNDHRGGVLALNDSALAEALQKTQDLLGLSMSEAEARVLWQRLQDFPERMERFNRNGRILVDFLIRHPKVARVFHPEVPEAPRHHSPLSGSGSVVSFQLVDDSLEAVQRFYDADLHPIGKGPTLGSNRTILCPYPLLAHYHAPLELVEQLCGTRHLIRVAAGCEADFTVALRALARGLDQV